MNLFTCRAGRAHIHRHLLDLFPLTWGRHLAIRSPPSLYQQEGALRRCCSSEPVQLDTKYCRESLLIHTCREKEEGKKKKCIEKNHNTAVQTELQRCCSSVSCILPGWAGGWKTYVCMYGGEQTHGTYYRSRHRTQRHDTLHTARQPARKMAEALKRTVDNRHALDLKRETIFKYY